MFDIEQAIRTNIIDVADKDYVQNYPSRDMHITWDLNVGNKFIKVIRDRSVWGFVAIEDGEHKGLSHKRGDVFKAASWNAPAKHARGNVFIPYKWNWTGPDYLKK